MKNTENYDSQGRLLITDSDGHLIMKYNTKTDMLEFVGRGVTTYIKCIANGTPTFYSEPLTKK